MKRFSLLLLLALLSLSSCKKEDPGTEGGGGGDKPREITVTGKVTSDDNKPLANVVVSDGIWCAKTDADGNYALGADLSKAKFIFVSTPSGYKAPKEDGHAIFWKRLSDYTKTDGKYTDIDFALEKISNPNHFTLFIYGDPQPRSKNSDWSDGSAYHSLDVCQDMYKDMKEYADRMTDRPVYGIGLGDIVHQKVKKSDGLLDLYKTGMAATGITTYNVIGNHDQGHNKGKTDLNAQEDFEDQMGPVNYSFNLGNLHFLMLDNMMVQDGNYSDECVCGLTDDIWQFVQNDLSFVSSDKTIMVCGHAPMFRKFDTGNDYDYNGKHISDLRNILSSRFSKVYAWAGHTHSTFNYVDKKDPKIETHTLGRVTGALWTNEYLSENGTPRGYMVFDYDAGTISWKFKPIFWQTAQHQQSGNKVPTYAYRDWNYDVSGRAVLKTGVDLTEDVYQMQVFKPGTYDQNDNAIYVNIFLWDELWQKPRLVINGEAMSVGTQTKDLYRYSYADREMKDFYARIWENLAGQWFHPKKEAYVYTGPYPDSQKQKCASIFKIPINDPQDVRSGDIVVTDRFGNTWETHISW